MSDSEGNRKGITNNMLRYSELEWEGRTIRINNPFMGLQNHLINYQQNSHI